MGAAERAASGAAERAASGTATATAPGPHSSGEAATASVLMPPLPCLLHAAVAIRAGNSVDAGAKHVDND